MNKIPGLSFTVTHSADRLMRQQDYIEDEIITTRKLLFGHPNITSSSYGIVSSDDPSGHSAGSSSPLAVSVNLVDSTTVDINPGIVVFQSGSYLELHDTVRGIELSDPSIGIPNVIYIRFLLASGDPVPNYYKQTISVPYTYRFGDPNNEGTVSSETVLVGSMTVDAWNALSSSTKEEYCSLAIVTSQTVVDSGTGTTSTELSIDHTRNSYDFNRPWFSSVDIEHRNKTGTGTVSDSNPHGIGPDDLIIGDLTMFDLYLDHGIIISKDKNVARVPGFLCTSAVTDVFTDDAIGTLTGYANASYIELPYFPVRVGRVWTNSGVELAGLHVPETNRIVFPTETPPVGDTITVKYTRAQAAEPPLSGNINFTIEGPGEGELVIAGGQGHTQLNVTEETFSDAGMFPMRYDILIDGDGNILKTPQVVYCRKKLDDIGTTDSFSITPYGEARLIVGLVEASSASTMEVKIKIRGTDTSGTNIEEEFYFKQSEWTNPSPVPMVPSLVSDSVRFGTKVFATLTDISILQRTDDGPNSAIMVWMANTPYNPYSKLKNAAHIATVDWDGTRMSTVFDKRIITTTIKDFINSDLTIDSYKYLFKLAAGGNATLFVDDFRAPKYHSLLTYEEIANDIKTYVSYTKEFSTLGMTKLRHGVHGFYRSITFPVFSGSGKVWRLSLFGENDTVDTWYKNVPKLLAYDGSSWNAHDMFAVSGVNRTFETSITYVPEKVRVYFYPGRANGMALYG